MHYNIKQVSWTSHEDALRFIRTEVFIKEQEVPVELEWDGLDEDCFHVLAENDTAQSLGCARMLADGHIGRMAVLPAFRHQGIGSALLIYIVQLAREKTLPTVFLNAQQQAVGFYERLGFAVKGDLFYDACIPHFRMTLDLKRGL